MVKLERYSNNPIISPVPDNAWEHDGAFNGCVVFHNGIYHMVYRALSSEKRQNGVSMRVSTVGYATSKDGVTFGEHKMLFEPTEDWEIYGCEDPRITYFEGKFYIFYTALSVFPFAAYGIKTAVAVTKDFKTFEKHPVSTFNAKAMALFPERVDGKIAALITINTDMPPAKICVATFDREEDIWSPYYWQEWYDNVNQHSLHLLRDLRDQIELGAPPVKTPDGWIMIYSYIGNYLSNNKDFGIEAALLDLKDPRQIIARTDHSLLDPVADYEVHGDVPNIVFPSGALIKDEDFYVYYGAADTRVGVAWTKLANLMAELKPVSDAPTIDPTISEIKPEAVKTVDHQQVKFKRFDGNPILTPSLELDWQTLGIFNPAVVYEDGKFHIVYRAQSQQTGTSVMGYAVSKDGYHIDENLPEPIYFPREDFEQKLHENGYSGCEDPRITRIDDRYFMCYTAYDGVNPPRVAMTSILVEDFLKRNWKWEKAQLISPPGVDDKDACVVKGKYPDTYLAFHRLGYDIWLEVRRDLRFEDPNWMDGKVVAHPRADKWDNVKLGIAGPPVETDKGWLLFYHGVSEPGGIYKVGAILLDYDDPYKILARTDDPVLEPEMDYEKEGVVPNVVFPCGQAVVDGTIYMYYGGADKVIGVATMPMDDLMKLLMK
jgi:beta-1,2-mannobiose phosphorylase / 1,2-beta-oligomannan phosphorylase